MPGTDRRIDPVTRDYVDDGRGSFETTTTIEPQLYHQLQGRLNEWAGDPDAGNDSHLIPRKASAGNLLRFKDAYQAALQPFIDAGLAADLQVEVEREGLNRFAVTSSIRDVQAGEIDVTPLLPFGA